MRSATIALVGVLGLVVGSFLNVVIYRVPRNQSVVRPRSSCPHCGHPIRDRDNIPVVSWLLLRGRCRDCAGPISIRYPAMELLTAALFAATAARFGPHAALPAYLVAVGGLVTLAAIDVELMTLPRKILYPVLALTTVLLAGASLWDHDWHRFAVGAGTAAVWFTVFFVINLVNPRALGFGDVRLSLLLGLALGWLGVGVALVGFFAANVLGAVVGVALIATKRMRRDQPIPYGVFLTAGFLLALFVGQQIVNAFPHPYY